MAAKDNLNKNLFHGTSHFFSEGEIIDPEMGRVPKVKRAFASNDLSYSRDYASMAAKRKGMLFAPVYRVEPLDKEENLDELGWKKEGVLSSKKGFEPKEIVDWGVRED